MNSTYAYLLLFFVVMIGVYFFPYRKVKDKVFKKLIYKDPSTAKYIKYFYGKVAVEAERSGNNAWKTVVPSAWNADQSAIVKLIVRLSDLVIVDRITNAKDEKKYGIGTKQSIEIFYGNKPIVIRFGNDVDGCEMVYANVESSDNDVITVSNSIKAHFPSCAEDFANLNIFNVSYEDVKSVESVFNNSMYLISKQSNGWLLRGNMLLEDKAKAIIGQIIGIRASTIVDDKIKLSPKPEGSITVKLSKKSYTRYFFVGKDETHYFVPMGGSILVVDQTVKELFEDK